MEKILARKLILITGVIFLFAPVFIGATTLEFNVDPTHDYQGRAKVEAFLHQLGDKAYFYVEEDYYQGLEIEEKKEFTEALRGLSKEFDEVIYPKLTAAFGSEWRPGIDGDDRITVLLTRIKDNRAGYFNPADEYPRAQSPISNEREMVYLNVDYIGKNLAKSYLAHEFMHLITFNQKDRRYGKTEEIWLNEGRAEYAPTFLGYDDTYQGSNLQKRVEIFATNPTDSLTEWKERAADYGVVNLFMQYLVDHYGIEILADSLRSSSEVGIPSLNYVLKRNRIPENFSQIFVNWAITVLANDCDLGAKYCYFNPNLINLKIVPQLNFLPLGESSILKATNYSKEWAGNWIKMIGGKGKVELEFVGEEGTNFVVFYLTKDYSGNYSINSLDLDSSQRGVAYISDFGTKYSDLILIPLIQDKISGFDGIEPYHQFIWSASVSNENSGGEEELIEELLAQIEYLQAEIARVQAKINAILAERGKEATCSRFENDLYYGMKDNSEVSCLQQFLKGQGEQIYPEGLVTGNFSNLTLQAVIRFQDKYKAEILTPVGLEEGTGYVGAMTRKKINELL